MLRALGTHVFRRKKKDMASHDESEFDSELSELNFCN
jgi:hypothetical protein